MECFILYFIFCLSVFLDELYCSLCQFVSCDAEETNTISLLLQEIKEKDLVSLFCS